MVNSLIAGFRSDRLSEMRARIQAEKMSKRAQIFGGLWVFTWPAVAILEVLRAGFEGDVLREEIVIL
jgi:hypothetical protein